MYLFSSHQNKNLGLTKSKEQENHYGELQKNNSEYKNNPPVF